MPSKHNRHVLFPILTAATILLLALALLSPQLRPALLPDRYSAFHFGDAIGPDGLTFDNQLRPGPATTRNAIALLRIHGAPQDLIRRALECAAMLDAQCGRTLQGR